jgi:glyoxylase-like metal-dependent hydrolase (beta-lactamase superfamily II)
MRRIGTATVIALDDGQGPFFEPRAQAIPTATAEHWRRADAADPRARGAAGEWLLRFRCFAIRNDDGRTVLVDAGIGPADAPAAAWAPTPGTLPESLAAAGIAPADVHAVVLTHLHTDHIGWSVTGGTPYFPNARYVMQRAEAEAISDLGAPAGPYAIAPLTAAGVLDLVDGDTRLAENLTAVATPGHTPGHQCALLDTGTERVLVTGDLLVHAVQLVEPALAYAHEMDPAAAAASRTELLRELAARPGPFTLASAHLGEAFTAGK